MNMSYKVFTMREKILTEIQEHISEFLKFYKILYAFLLV
jgi:hypothetical protein